MADCLEWLWANLDLDNALFSEQMAQLWPGNGFERLRALGILRQAENATYVACPSCMDDHEEEVIALPDDHGHVIPRMRIPGQRTA